MNILANDKISPIESHWDAEALLNAPGIFFLKDVVKIIKDLHSYQVKNIVKGLQREEKDPRSIMGVDKTMVGWIVKMSAFAPYYRQNLNRPYSHIPAGWDWRELLQQQSGIYTLQDVCRLLPLEPGQVRWQAKLNKKTGATFHNKTGRHLVELSVFIPWFKENWLPQRGVRAYMADEMIRGKVDPSWGKDELLCQQGVFSLTDIKKPLRISPLLFSKHHKAILDNGENPYDLMGAANLWGHWYVRMTVFSNYFRKHFEKSYKTVNDSWSVEDLLSQSGDFRAVDVARLLSRHILFLRYWGRKEGDENPGIWKSKDGLLVRMESFSVWYKEREK